MVGEREPAGNVNPLRKHAMTATLTRAATRTGAPRAGRSRETLLFLIAIALIALHVLDDNYLQPQPGMSPADHVVSGVVPLALLGLAAWAYPRLRGGRRGRSP